MLPLKAKSPTFLNKDPVLKLIFSQIQFLLTLSSVRRFQYMFCYSYIHLKFQLQLQLKGPCCNLSTIKAFVTVKKCLLGSFLR